MARLLTSTVILEAPNRDREKHVALEIRQFPCFQDNYGYLIRDTASGRVASIDSPEPDKVNAALEAAGWRLDEIWNTHHHWDHAGGNLALKDRWRCRIIGPRDEAAKIPGIDRAVGEGDDVSLGESRARGLDTPGHTAGHIVYYFAADGVAFVGDTIFALGCGRLFEGAPAEMWNSLGKIAALPPDTRLYCAHEYTQTNARFALSLEPENAALSARAAAVDAARAKGRPTVPTSVAAERETNPFLRANDPDLKAAVGLAGADPVDVFAEIRRRKDAF